MENWHLTEKWYFVKTDIMAFFHSMQKVVYLMLKTELTVLNSLKHFHFDSTMELKSLA